MMINFKSYFSGSSGNLHTCSDGITNIILDFGVTIKVARTALNFDLSRFSGVLVSHCHKDHCKGIPAAIKSSLDCYLSLDTIEDLKVLGHRVHEIKAMELFKIGTLWIKPFSLEHDVPNLGFLIESDLDGKMVYATDTYYIRFRFKNVNVWAIECNYSKDILEKNINTGVVPAVIRNRIVKSHFSLENVKKFFMANDLSKTKEIHLIHLSENNGDSELFKQEIQELTGNPVFI